MKIAHSILPVIAVLAIGILAGCGPKQETDEGGFTAKPGVVGKPGSSAKKQLKVGFSQIGAESGWRTAETKSIQEEAEKRGIDLKISDAQQKQENQIKAVRSFIAQGVDAIILAPVIETGWDQVLLEAKKAKIPVILADRGITVTDDTLYATLVSPDVVEEGRMAGRWLAKKLNGKGNIVELKGTPGSSPAKDRETGFHEIIAGFPGMSVVKSQTGEFTRAKGKEVMEAFLKGGDRIDAVFAHNDEMAIGAIQAIEAAGRKPGTEITVVSIDAVRGAFEAMIAGKLNCTVECCPLLGPPIFDAIEAVTSGNTVAKKISLKEQLFEQSTARNVIKTRVY